MCFLHLSCSLCLVQRGEGKAHFVSQTPTRASVHRSGLRVSSKEMPAPQSDLREQDVPPVWVVRPVAKECPLRRQTFAKVNPSGMGAGGIHAEECPLRGLTLAWALASSQALPCCSKGIGTPCRDPCEEAVGLRRSPGLRTGWGTALRPTRR